MLNQEHPHIPQARQPGSWRTAEKRDSLRHLICHRPFGRRRKAGLDRAGPVSLFPTLWSFFSTSYLHDFFTGVFLFRLSFVFLARFLTLTISGVSILRCNSRARMSLTQRGWCPKELALGLSGFSSMNARRIYCAALVASFAETEPTLKVTTRLNPLHPKCLHRPPSARA